MSFECSICLSSERERDRDREEERERAKEREREREREMREIHVEFTRFYYWTNGQIKRLGRLPESKSHKHLLLCWSTKI